MASNPADVGGADSIITNSPGNLANPVYSASYATLESFEELAVQSSDVVRMRGG